MRFVSNGPDLSDDLLTARDDGHVLFFCGAGVSQANAGLPNFSGLARDVLRDLGSALDSPARRLFQASVAFEESTGLSGQIATDRIFGMLEEEFIPAELRASVAAALRPKAGYGLQAHNTIIDLSTTRSGVTRLVTTNFDLLFEECDPELPSHNPPRLPDPKRDADFQGIIHIHGHVDPEYSMACDDEFVLSSSDFGRAYLSDGWATRYIQTLLGQFKIVFLGYSADDPPVQYLLEALNRSGSDKSDLYAFQAGDVSEAAARWAHKGVRPIPYDSKSEHTALWQTLEAWASRARDVDAWHQSIIANASIPDARQPFERGQIAHIAATTSGAKHLVDAPGVLPPSWLLVFDRHARYGDLGPLDFGEDASPRFDPFENYGLDADEPPPPSDPDDRYTRREAPADAWDAFSVTRLDLEKLDANGAGKFRDSEARDASNLPVRLWHLGMYLMRVVHTPEALWWSARQPNLHPHLQHRIEWVLRQQPERFTDDLRKGWRFLIDSWREPRADQDMRRFDIEAQVKLDGWALSSVRQLMTLYRPRLTVKASYSIRPPEERPDLSLGEIIRVDVDYPRPHDRLPVPREFQAYAVSIFRQQIVHAIALERETSESDEIYFDTTRADDGQSPDEDAFQLTGHLNIYTNMILELAEHDHDAAKVELAVWQADNSQVSQRLKIWSAGTIGLTTPSEASDTFLGLDEHGFWTDKHERDLLYALRDRWADLPDADREQIERRLLTGNFPWKNPPSDVVSINAYHRLNRLQWLHNQGTGFGFDLDAEIKKLKEVAPEWQAEYAADAARPKVGKAYTIETDTNPAGLLNVSIDQIIATARDLSGRAGFYSRTENRPFAGLAVTHPSRALGALTSAARNREFYADAWTQLLYAEGKAATDVRFLRAIGLRLARLEPGQVIELAHPISEWLRDRAKILLPGSREIFDKVWNAVVGALAASPPQNKFRRSDASWVDDGLNRPAGRLVFAAFDDPTKSEFVKDGKLPDMWKARLKLLLDLPVEHRQHAIAMITPHLNWLFHIDPEWSTQNLVAVACNDDADAAAFWDGYFWGAKVPQEPLYRLLKPALVALARTADLRRDHTIKLAGILLAGWTHATSAEDDRSIISDLELREILIHGTDDLRGQVLRSAENWTNHTDGTWGENLSHFLKNVWPRQAAVRSASISGRLVDLALSMPDRFEEVMGLIMPLLTPIKRVGLRLDTDLDDDNGIAARFPSLLLELLWRVLPDDAASWPYNTEKILTALSGAPDLATDARLAELQRRHTMTR